MTRLSTSPNGPSSSGKLARTGPAASVPKTLRCSSRPPAWAPTSTSRSLYGDAMARRSPLWRSVAKSRDTMPKSATKPPSASSPTSAAPKSPSGSLPTSSGAKAEPDPRRNFSQKVLWRHSKGRAILQAWKRTLHTISWQLGLRGATRPSNSPAAVTRRGCPRMPRPGSNPNSQIRKTAATRTARYRPPGLKPKFFPTFLNYEYLELSWNQTAFPLAIPIRKSS